MDRARNILVTLLMLGAASAVGYLFEIAGFPDTSIAFLFLLAVLFAAWLSSSLGVGLFASIAATFVFNYFFAAPRFTFAVNDPNYYVTFVALIITSILVSTLTTRARKEAQLAQEREEETKSIYMLTNRLSDAGTRDDIVAVALAAIREGLQCGCGCLCLDGDGQPEATYVYLPEGEGSS